MTLVLHSCEALKCLLPGGLLYSFIYLALESVIDIVTFFLLSLNQIMAKHNLSHDVIDSRNVLKNLDKSRPLVFIDAALNYQ